MIKYKATFWSLEVHKKIIEKETDKFVVFENGVREAKESRYAKYFDTETDALKFLISNQSSKAESLKYSLTKIEQNVTKLRAKLAEAQQRHGAEE